MGRTVTAIVDIEYAKPKASLLLPTDSASWIKTLRPDLKHLGCPHPKKTNLTLVAPGRLTFLWDTCIGSPLYKNLRNALCPSSTTRQSLSINHLSLKFESADFPLPDPYVPPPDSSAGPERGTKSPNTPISQLPLNTPVVKTEVVDPVLSPPPPKSAPIALITQQVIVPRINSTPCPPSDNQAIIPPTQRVTSPGDSSATISPHAGSQVTATRSPTTQPTLKRAASTPLTPPNRQPINPAELRARLNALLQSIRASIVQQLHEENDIIQKLSRLSNHAPPPLALPLVGSVVPRSKLEEIEALLRNERDLRAKAESDRQVTIGKLQTISQRGITAQLDRMNAEKRQRIELDLRTVAEKRLADAENALVQERTLRLQAEWGQLKIKTALEGDRQLRVEAEQRLTGTKDELHRERQLRAKAENCLADIERECRHPFVVPAMLSAFKIVSELTPQPMIPKS